MAGLALPAVVVAWFLDWRGITLNVIPGLVVLAVLGVVVAVGSWKAARRDPDFYGEQARARGARYERVPGVHEGAVLDRKGIES